MTGPEEVTLVSLAAALDRLSERLDAVEDRLNPPKRDPASTTDGRFERGSTARKMGPGLPRRVHPFGEGIGFTAQREEQI